MRARALLASVAVLGAVLLPASVRADATVPALKHVFVIVEENTDYAKVTGSADAPTYNALRTAHVGHETYSATSHVSLGNYIGLVSGQIPLPLDHVDCPPYPLCVRPGPTIGAQLDAAGKTWKGYFQSMGTPCRHPSSVVDSDQTGYATRHNPFVYFSEIVNDPAYCAAHDVDYTQLATDLASPEGPPSLSFIVPNTCDDGHDAGCDGTVDPQVKNLDQWLTANLPPILDYINATDTSGHYTHPDSALFITFDEASNTDTSGCCDQLPLVQGGGHVGFVMVAPGHENPTHVANVAANHYSFLRTLEDAFGLPHLAQADSPLQHSMTDLFG